MTRASPPQFSFASGEIAPVLHGRPDFTRYQSGLHTCRGFMPLAEGPVTRMPGTRHIGTTKDGLIARLVSFVFAEDDTHILEFSHNAMRVWRGETLILSGSDPLVVPTPWGQEDLEGLQFAQSASRIYVTDGRRAPKRINRLALDDWTIDDVPFENGPYRASNTDDAIVLTASGTTGTATLTASEDLWTAGHVGAFWQLTPESEADVPYWSGNTEIEIGDLMRYDGRVYEVTAIDIEEPPEEDPPVEDPVDPDPSTDPSAEPEPEEEEEETLPTTGPNPPVHDEGDWLSSKGGPTWTYRYGEIASVRITGFTNARTVTVEIADELPPNLTTDGTSYWAEGAWSDERGYPAALAFHEQRFVLATTPADPQTIWFSTVGDFTDFSPSTLADGSFAYAISSTGNRVNAIRWIVSGGRTLHIGTAGDEYSARASSTDVVIGPTNAVFRPDTTEGSAPIQPVLVDGTPLFVSRDLRRVHELAYDFGSDRVDAPEITRAARHIFGAGILRIVWQSSPWRVLWAVLADGGLGALAYDQRQDQMGAARTAAGGRIVESIAVLPADVGGQERLWMVVRRGAVRSVEIMQPVFEFGDTDDPADAWHLWNALSYRGADTDSFEGLDHLEGQEVHAWTEAGGFGPLTVTDGTVTLPRAVGRALIGLHDETDRLETLHQSAGAADGGSQGRQSRHKATGIRLRRTAGGTIDTVTEAGREGRTGRAVPLVPRIRDAFAVPPLFDGIVDLPAEAAWGKEVRHRIVPAPGAPLTLSGITPIIQMADA